MMPRTFRTSRAHQQILLRWPSLQGRFSRNSHDSASCNHGPPLSSSPPVHNNSNQRNIFLRPVLFTGAVCLGSFGFASIYEYEQSFKTAEEWRQELFRVAKRPTTPIYWRVAEEHLPPQLMEKIKEAANDPRAKTVGPIIALNVALHLVFLIPSFRMIKHAYFVHHSGSGSALPMFLSTFAHSGIFHLGINSYVLWNMGNYAVKALGFENHREQFWAAYVSAGTLASLGTIMGDWVLFKLRARPMTAGLGASGAMYAAFMATSLVYPDDLRAKVFFIHEMSLGQAMKCLIAFDLAGWLFLGNMSPFGHAAHLAGAAAGYWAIQMGGLDKIQDYRVFVLNAYANLKKKMLESSDKKDF